jgi:ligand-binding sensor domain-containing protein/serine phosphatase RsbU (regulator of sigma subunit)
MIFSHNPKIRKVIRLIKRITFFYAVILLSISNLSAQTYYFDYYGAKEGLQSKVYDVLQDDNGYVWLATESGISKFDGVKFTNYTTEDGLEPGEVKHIIKDNKGNIWMGHTTGKVSFFDGETIRKHPIGEIISMEITSLLIDKEDVLWISTTVDGLFRIENPYEFDSGKIKYDHFKGRLSDRVFSVVMAKNDSVFFITDVGIRKYNKIDSSFIRHKPKGLTNYWQITTMFEDSKGDVWYGTYHGGLYRYLKEKNEFKIYDVRDGLADNWVTTITEDSKGNVWAGTWGGGITKFSENGLKTYNNNNGLIDHKISKIVEDIEGNILIATNDNGLAIFKGEKFEFYSTNDGLINKQVRAIVRDNGGKYWFGTDKGISVYNPKAGSKGIKFAHYNQESNMIGDHIGFLRKDLNGNIWIGTDQSGLTMFNYKTGRFVTNPYINRYFNRTGMVTALDIDKKNQLWIGTQVGLIYHEINEDKTDILTQINGLNGTEISAVFADSKDRTWVGIKGKGLNLIIEDSIVKVDMDYVVTPQCIIEDKSGNIWIGTMTKGILIYDGEKIIRKIGVDEGLLSNFINQLNIDDNNNVFVGTGRGLNKIDKNQNIHVYTEKSGFTGIEAKKNATYKDDEGNLWFGTVEGVIKYSPKLDFCAPQEPLTHISRFRINQVDRKMILDQKLNYLENSVIFDYNSICLNNPDAVQYQIMLDPADKDWRPITEQTGVNYSSLAPERYTFKVKAKNSAGIWNTEPVSYTFTIRPPFYKTWWFILAMVVAGILVIVSYIKVREKNLVKEKKILEDKVEERTAEVVQKSIEIEQKNKDITDSIRYAKRIQTAVLPPELPFDDTFIFFRPKDIVSGDFYWLETIGDKEMIAAVDCTGHGVPGAFLSILGHSMLTKIVREYGILEPANILDQLDLEIINALHQKDSESDLVVNDGMDLALICYNKDTQIMEFAGAFNPLIRIRNGEMEEIKADRFPIGMTSIHDNKKFTNHEIKVEKGDSYYIFSDGYADQFGGKDGRKFRKKNMKDLLISIQGMSMKEQGEELERFMLDWMKNHEQIDDIVFIGRRF